MANETIELAKSSYRPDKMTYPAAVSIKLDGVPGVFMSNKMPLTRQGEIIKSVAHIQNFIVQHMPHGVGIVGELYDPELKFKVISGQVRDKTNQHPNLVLNAFDLFVPDNLEAKFKDRTEALRIFLEDVAGGLGKHPNDLPVVRIPQVIVQDEEQAREAHDAIMAANPDAEGTVLASLERTWQPAKRGWNVQKCKPEPTIDLEIIGFQEAVEKDTGRGLGRVGRLVAKLWKIDDTGKPQANQIGIGPGRLTHKEAKALWREYKSKKWMTKIAEVKYMKDDSYDALRQPTFQRWRSDKEEPDVIGEM